MANGSASGLDRVVAAIEQLPAVTWPGGYDEIVLAILDAVWSPASKHEAHVKHVVARYRSWRPSADQDTVEDLIDAIDGVGGPERFADDVVRNRQRTSSRSGILTSEAVRAAAQAFVDSGVRTAEILRHAQPEMLERARVAWRGVRGHGSGITFRYLLILVRIYDVKPDRMVIQFLIDVTSREPNLDEAVELVTKIRPPL